MKGRGQLQHHFWGEYVATIVLQFLTTQDRDYAHTHAFPMFRVLTQFPASLGFHGGGGALKDAEKALEKHKADMKKVGSMRYSIDVGEPFEVHVDVKREKEAHDGSVQPLLWEGD